MRNIVDGTEGACGVGGGRSRRFRRRGRDGRRDGSARWGSRGTVRGFGDGGLIGGLRERRPAAEEQKGRPFVESCANREHCLVALLVQAALVE